MFKLSIFKKNKEIQIARPDFQFGVPEKHKVVTKLISYKRYGEILFQKVASGYLPHFVQDGSSKNILDKYLLRNKIENPKMCKHAVYIPPLTPDQPPLKAAAMLVPICLPEY